MRNMITTWLTDWKVGLALSLMALGIVWLNITINQWFGIIMGLISLLCFMICLVAAIYEKRAKP